MLISDKYKIGFIHIPRTGGGSMKQAIISADKTAHRVGIYHQPITVKLHNDYKDYHKFAIARNSWELIVSFYRYFVEKKNLGIPFEKYIRENLPYKKSRFPHQLQFLKYEDRLLVDEILMFDNLKENYRRLCQRMQMPCHLTSRVHYTGTGNAWQRYYNKDTKDFVYDLCKEDIDYFNFKF